MVDAKHEVEQVSRRSSPVSELIGKSVVPTDQSFEDIINNNNFNIAKKAVADMASEYVNKIVEEVTALNLYDKKMLPVQ